MELPVSNYFRVSAARLMHTLASCSMHAAECVLL
jgi:hypothetical protein